MGYWLLGNGRGAETHPRQRRSIHKEPLPAHAAHGPGLRSCLYLNPWPTQPYDGVLAKLPTFRFENGEVREYPRYEPLHESAETAVAQQGDVGLTHLMEELDETFFRQATAAIGREYFLLPIDGG